MARKIPSVNGLTRFEYQDRNEIERNYKDANDIRTYTLLQMSFYRQINTVFVGSAFVIHTQREKLALAHTLALAVDAGILSRAVTVGPTSEGAEAAGARLVLGALSAREAG